MKFVWLLSSVLLGVAGQLLMKWGLMNPKPLWNQGPSLVTMFSSWPVLAGLFSYALSSLFWLLTLKQMNISVAYPMVSLGYVVVAFAGYYLFSETITAGKWVGIGFVLLGVVFISRT
ncbi:EamA family transporter [Paenibacillus mesophilus]|uniref:EamA family transporter n=1 Tax=Paenibacillus mesophilus TaxID=2582849 RepID=UPI0013051A75|nr:EamA family transporter [Paenibacillus mesophilus]